MYYQSSRIRWSLLAVAAWLCAFMSPVALAGTITAGTPSDTGTDTFTIHDQLTHQNITFSITIGPFWFTPGGGGSPGQDPGANKATLIKNAAIAAGVPPADVVVNGNTVTFLGYTVTGSTIGTGETSTIAMAEPTTGAMDFEFASGYASLGGTDADMNAATYTMGLSFDDTTYGDVNVSSTIGYSSLTTPTVSGLLSQEYQNLEGSLDGVSPSLATQLSLDLPNDSIDFTFPSDATEGSVTVGTTDVSLDSTEALTPEPSSLLLLALPLVLMAWMKARMDRRA